MTSPGDNGQHVTVRGSMHPGRSTDCDLRRTQRTTHHLRPVAAGRPGQRVMRCTYCGQVAQDLRTPHQQDPTQLTYPEAP